MILWVQWVLGTITMGILVYWVLLDFRYYGYYRILGALQVVGLLYEVVSAIFVFLLSRWRQLKRSSQAAKPAKAAKVLEAQEEL